MAIDKNLMMEAGEEVTYSNCYWGKCLLSIWEGCWPRNPETGKICGAPLPYQAGQDDPRDRVVMIEMIIDLIPGCSSNYPIQVKCPKSDKDWQKIVLPSIRDAGAVNKKGQTDLFAIADHYVKVQQVDGLKLRDKNNPDKGTWRTLQVLKIFKNEKEAADDMAGETGEPVPSESKPAAATTNANNQRRKAALEFCRVAIQTYRGMEAEEIRKKADQFIQSSDTVKPFVTVDDPEVKKMIEDAAAEEIVIPFD